MANDGVSIELRSGQVHALLGPNGAGKSTLINLLSGELGCSSGQVMFRGRDITPLRADERSRLGIGRSFQKTNIFPSFTVEENCRMAAQSRDPRAWRIASRAAIWPPYVEVVQRALREVDLSASAHRLASELSHGEQRQLELALVLCTQPDVLLLDEPLAGMGHEESARMIELLGRMRQSHAVLLVEHDMEAVFSIADVITVMVDGRVLTTGTPAEVRSSAEVRAAYLGEEGCDE